MRFSSSPFLQVFFFASGPYQRRLSSPFSSKDTSILVHSRKAPYPLLHRLDLHTGPVNALSLDSHCLASASGDGRLRIWDLETGECKRRLKGHERGLACVGLKGGWVVSGSNDQTYVSLLSFRNEIWVDC